MTLTEKQINTLLDDVRRGTSALLIGQQYFCIDNNFYKQVTDSLNIRDSNKSFYDLWSANAKQDNLKQFGEIMENCAYQAVYQPWLRAVFSMGWNVVLSSCAQSTWIKNSLGNNFSLTIDPEQTQPVPFSKKKLNYISLYGNENNLPDEKRIRTINRNSKIFSSIFDLINQNYGHMIIDGIAEDDWFDVKNILNKIDFDKLYDCVYIFSMSERQIEDHCDPNDLEDLKGLINSRQIILCESSLKDIITEYDMAEDETEEDTVVENTVRISLSDNDCFMLLRNECTRLKQMGITVMRDEILNPLILDDTNKQEYLADFFMQNQPFNWGYFDVIYQNKRTSFHVNRSPSEGLMINNIKKQLKKPTIDRDILLLKGNSNSGKTTTLRWIAYELTKSCNQKEYKKSGKYIVFYINGNPAEKEDNWKDQFVNFVKTNINSGKTIKKDRIRNIIIIWDNYNASDKTLCYLELFRKLNECNAVIIGSIYTFEETVNSVRQGTAFNETALSSKLDASAQSAISSILKMIDGDMYRTFSDISKNDYLFETLMNFSKYKYSPKWNELQNMLRANLNKEAKETEDATDRLFNDFRNKNPDSFEEVQKIVFKLGIGASSQAAFASLTDNERIEKNKPLINSIRDMNMILAVAGQFKNQVRLPLSLLINTITAEKRFHGEYNKLNRILKNDSMVEYTVNNGKITVSFRHPSEAIAYLENNLLSDSIKNSETEVIHRLIKHCRWENYEEATAVAKLIRSFGTNSFGKYNEGVQYTQYNEYQKYWKGIAETLNRYASGNPEAMLIAGHFTRDWIAAENISGQDAVELLKYVFNNMSNAAENSNTLYSSKTRLYGEMCSNLLKRMDNGENSNDIEIEFKENFQNALTNLNSSKSSGRSSIGNKASAMLLDIWLQYVFKKENDQIIKLLPVTLQYIDHLLYEQADLIDRNVDYVYIINHISKIYEMLEDKTDDQLRSIFTDAQNDSYIYCIVKKKLIKVFSEYKNIKIEINENNREPRIYTFSEADSLEDNKNKNQIISRISRRIFFMNENSFRDFDRSYKEVDSLFNDIKISLKITSEEIIEYMNKNYDSFRNMSYRCLMVYLRAKWMYYTGNLVLETGQYPALTDMQWKELYDICCEIQGKTPYGFNINRAVTFIQNIYRYCFTTEFSNFNRQQEDPNRIICLCRPMNGSACPRLFRVSIKQKNDSNKYVATIDKEIENGKTKASLIKRGNIHVPNDIKGYTELTNKNLNIDRDFVLWFNFSGAQIRDPEPINHENE